MAEVGGLGGQQPGGMTPPRVGAAAADAGSPAGQRSRVSAMGLPVVDASKPDRPMIGMLSIRDIQTAQIAIQASLSEVNYIMKLL